MSALDVVPVPGYPGYYARRCAVEAWERAGSPALVDAGRLYQNQKDAYDGWKAGKPGFNPADNPDDESQRLAHVRFVAFDLKNPARDRAAMIREGFEFPYSYEPWHAELPNVRSYAIVRSIPTPANPLEDNMPIHVRREKNNAAYTVVPGVYIKHVPDKQNEKIALYTSTPGDTFKGLNEGDFSIMLWDLGFAEFQGNNDRAPLNGGTHWAQRK